MAFKKGDPKPPGSGMKKGQKTRRSTEAAKIFDEKAFDPLEEVIDRLKKNGKFMDDDVFMSACLKLAKFRYTELKSVDHHINPKELADKELIEEAARLAEELRSEV
jgi:hypothetical protein